MSLGCARCGNCCSRIWCDDVRVLAKWTTEALAGVPDPADDDGWAYWTAQGEWTDEHRETAISRYHGERRRRDADFITAHWHPNDDGETWHCDALDPDTRLCTVHEDRPPVCRDYPWYGEDPAKRASHVGPECSYLLDVPPAERPEGARPLIPLTVA
jgi:Fe-S-cluster containining protein